MSFFSHLCKKVLRVEFLSINKLKIRKYIIGAVFFLLLYSCAQIVSPTGGPEDRKPPEVLLSIPDNYSSNFNKQHIRLEFDEFIQLDGVHQAFLSSPLLKETPEFRQRGKLLFVEFEDTLRENTTYTFNFENSITDFTEGNPIKNYEFVFSTGAYVDSLAFRGKILNAQDLVAKEGVVVMLYENYYDSIPYLEKPTYLAKVKEDGSFAINNLSNRDFKIFALIDKNQNYMYDLPNEEIAFLDSLIHPDYIKKYDGSIDTTSLDSLTLDSLGFDVYQIDSIFNTVDSLKKADSIARAEANNFTDYEMFLFQEKDTVQKLLNSEAKMNYKLTFILKNPVKSPSIKTLDTVFMDNWYLEDFSKEKDTLTYWLLDVVKDSLIVELSDNQSVIDTIEFKLEKPKKPEPKKEPKKKKGKPKPGRTGRSSSNPNALSFKTSVSNNGVIDYFRPLVLQNDIPLKQHNLSCIKLTEDSVEQKINPCFTDSLKRTIQIPFPWAEEKKYQLIMADSCFATINNLYNDSLILNFTASTPDNYAGFYLNFTPADTSYLYILQLLDAKGNLLKELYTSRKEQVTFLNLKPAEYKLKLIEDRNKNKKWDTGSYLDKLQPEKVYFFNKTISIKAGWDVEEDWNMIDNSE